MVAPIEVIFEAAIEAITGGVVSGMGSVLKVPVPETAVLPEPSVDLTRKKMTVSAGSPVRTIECPVLSVPFETMLPGGEVVPYSTTELAGSSVFHEMVAPVEVIFEAAIEAITGGVVSGMGSVLKVPIPETAVLPEPSVDLTR